MSWHLSTKQKVFLTQLETTSCITIPPSFKNNHCVNITKSLFYTTTLQQDQLTGNNNLVILLPGKNHLKVFKEKQY